MCACAPVPPPELLRSTQQSVCACPAPCCQPFCPMDPSRILPGSDPAAANASAIHVETCLAPTLRQQDQG
eukprot:365781-Chlamydomonas_euryale.AAC.4